MLYDVVHRTTYRYGQPVDLAWHVACLKPRAHRGQTVTDVRLLIDPAPTYLAERPDDQGNLKTLFSIEQSHHRLHVVLRAVIAVAHLVPAATPAWEAVAAASAGPWPEDLDAARLATPSPGIQPPPELHAYARRAFTPGRPVLEAGQALMRQIHAEMSYESGVTDVTTPITAVFRHKRGVCQDFAHLMIGCLRTLGLPARYVSGYLRTRPLGFESGAADAAGAPLRGADASHAWVSLWCGAAAGWVDLDPTNALTVDHEHLTIGWGREFADVSPLRGVILGGGAHRAEVAVTVTAIG